MKDWRVYALILAATSLSYFNALSVGFVSDDAFQIVNNPDIKSWSNLPGLFTTGVWHTEQYTGGFYRPLAFASWLVEYSLAGAKPLLYHIDNIILHFLCSVAAYLVVRRLASDRLTPAFAALLFAVHPVHAEAVTWIACRMELMYSLFTLSALWLFMERPRTPGYVAAACLLFMAGLLSKEAAVVLPVLILAYIVLYEPPAKGGAGLKRIAVLLLPYAATALLYVLIRLSVMGLTDQGVTYIYTNYENIGPYRMFLTMCQAFYEYVRLGFLPFDQRLEYVFRPPDGITSPRVMFTLAALPVIAVFSRRLARSSRTACIAVLWFIICLLPVSNIIPAGIIMTERAAYLPLLGPCILIALGFSAAVRQGGGRAALFANAALALVLAVFTFGTHQRNSVWAGINQNTVIGIMEERTRTFPDNAVNYGLLAQAYFDAGEFGKKTEDAIKKGLSINPDDDTLHYLHARVLYKQSRKEESLASIRKAIAINPEAKYYGFAGVLLDKLGSYEDAAAMLDTAIRLEPDSPGYYVDKGNLLIETAGYKEALEMFARALKLDPDNKDAYLGTGIVYDAMGDTEKAVASIRKAVELAPGSPDLHYFLANAYMRAGRREEAVSELREALRLRPDFPDAAKMLEHAM